MNIIYIIFLFSLTFLNGEEVKKLEQDSKKFVANAPGLLLPGSSVEQVIKIYGKPDYQGEGFIVYNYSHEIQQTTKDGKELITTDKGLVVFLIVKEKVEFSETISNSGKVLMSTFKNRLKSE